MTGLQMKFGLAMDLPEDKRAGYYAQIVKALAGKASLFDRDKELLIFSTPQEREQAKPIMNQYSVPCEEFDLLLLPSTVRMSLLLRITVLSLGWRTLISTPIWPSYVS